MKRFLLILGLTLSSICLTAAPLHTTAPVPEPITVLATAYVNQGTVLTDVFNQDKANVLEETQVVPVTKNVTPVCLNELQHFYRPIVYEYVASEFAVIKVIGMRYQLCSNKLDIVPKHLKS